MYTAIPNNVSRVLNAYSITRYFLSNYTQVTLYTNVVSNEVLFPLLMTVIKHKIAVLIIL
jgi:hypothetical protein